MYRNLLRTNDIYRVTSWLPETSPARLRAAAGADPADPRWTVVPAAVAPRVRALARELTASSDDRFDKVATVENYLRANEKYDLDSPEPAPGDDAVDDFVFVSHQGFCEQFATAAVVMLRSVGIPARLVTGYAFGQPDGDRLVFRGTNAHAWVQVYYPGVGWVDSDPTASAAQNAAGTRSQTSSGPSLEKALNWLWRHTPGGRVGAAILVVALVVIGVGVAALVRRRRARARRRRPFMPADGDGPALAALLRLEAALAEADRARAPADRPRALGETLGEFAGRLGGLVASAGEVAAAMRCVERECYARGSRRPSDAEVEAAVAVFERLRAAARSQTVALAPGSPGGSGSGSRGGRR